MHSFLLAISLLASALVVESTPVVEGTSIAEVEKRTSATHAHPNGAVYLGTWYMDCSASPESCNNLCYSRYCMQRNNGQISWAPSMNSAHRKASGADDWQCPSGDDCDEWPAAATGQGGFGAILSCIRSGDNRSGGSQMKAWVENAVSDAYLNANQNPYQGTPNGGRQRTFEGREGDYFDYDVKNVNLANSPRCAARAGGATQKQICNMNADGSTPQNTYHFRLLNPRQSGVKPTANDYARCAPVFQKRELTLSA